MPLPKTSKAVIKTARLNPINPEEASALKIIADNEAKGFNFKETIVDAVNRCGGLTPDMFTKQRGLTEQDFRDFASQLLSEIGNSKGRQEVAPVDDDGAEVSKFTQTFLTGLRQRQQQTDDDE